MISIGMTWAVISGIGFGIFSLTNRIVVRKMEVFVGAFILFTFTALTLGVMALFAEDLSLWQQLSPLAVFYFAVAGLFHFFIGWTLFLVSQRKIGAARTSVTMSTMPFFATITGWLFLGELLTGLALAGIGLIILGVYVVAQDKVDASQTTIETGWQSYLYGLGTALCFAISPIFTRLGLQILPAPLIGSTIGMSTCVLAFVILLSIQRGRGQAVNLAIGRNLFLMQIVLGGMGGFATGARWIALQTIQVAPVVALSRLSVPIILFLSPIVIGQQHEQVTLRVWLGAASIFAGSFLLIFYA